MEPINEEVKGIRWVDGAEQILKQQNKAIGYKKLTDEILKSKLLQSKSKTPI